MNTTLRNDTETLKLLFSNGTVQLLNWVFRVVRQRVKQIVMELLKSGKQWQ